MKKQNAFGLILANPDNDLQFETIRTTLKNHSLQKRFSLTQMDSVFKMKYVWRDTIKYSKTTLIPNNRIKSILNISTKKLKEAILKNEIGKIPKSIIKIKYERIHDTINTSNVCGIIKGKSKKSIIISAHYDHLGSIVKNYFPGADDNASGTAALMEIAEEFSNCKDLNFNLVFLATTGEEEGLLGSKYFVSQDNFNPKNVICNLNMDMISRYDTLHEYNQKYLYCIGTDNSKELNLIFKKAAKFYDKCSFDFSLDNSKDPFGIYSMSDQYAFYKKGIPSVFLFTGLHEDYHKLTDTENKINYSILENRVRLISVIIKLLQNEWIDK